MGVIIIEESIFNDALFPQAHVFVSPLFGEVYISVAYTNGEKNYCNPGQIDSVAVPYGHGPYSGHKHATWEDYQ